MKNRNLFVAIIPFFIISIGFFFTYIVQHGYLFSSTEQIRNINFWAFPITIGMKKILWLDIVWRLIPFILIFFVLLRIGKENTAKEQLAFCIPIFITVIFTALTLSTFKHLLAPYIDSKLFLFLYVCLSFMCGIYAIITSAIIVHVFISERSKFKTCIVLTIIINLLISTFSGIVSINTNMNVLFDYSYFITIGTIMILLLSILIPKKVLKLITI